MEKRNEFYLLILSILLGISVLKFTELFQLGTQLKEVLISIKAGVLSVQLLLVYFFIGSYIVFYLLVGLSAVGIVNQFRSTEPPEKKHDLGPLVAMCVGALTVSYLLAFSLIIHQLSAGEPSRPSTETPKLADENGAARKAAP
jgi:hypothetical protein